MKRVQPHTGWISVQNGLKSAMARVIGPSPQACSSPCMMHCEGSESEEKKKDGFDGRAISMEINSVELG